LKKRTKKLFLNAALPLDLCGGLRFGKLPRLKAHDAIPHRIYHEPIRQ
jgi:hypothetical protein